MEITVEPFKAHHAAEMKVQAAQRADVAAMSPELLKALESSDAWTGRIDGEIVVIGGLAEMWPGRALMWSCLAEGAGRHLLAVTRGVLRLLEASPHRRVECHVDCHFSAGHRWMRLLGFVCEAPRMPGFFPDGRDAALYGRVR